MARMVKNASERFTTFEISAAKNYLQPSVRSYLEDLLVEAAKQQKYPIPTFPDPNLSDFWLTQNETEQDLTQRPREHEELKMSSVIDKYFEWVEKYFDKTDTKINLNLVVESSFLLWVIFLSVS